MMTWAQIKSWEFHGPTTIEGYLKQPYKRAIPDIPIAPPIPVVEGTRYIVAMTVHLRASNARIAKKKMKRQIPAVTKVSDMFEERRRWFRAVCSYEFQAQGTTYQIPIRG